MEIQPAHLACVVGGGIAGSEAVARLAERKVHSVVFEMEALPYGKIELGLPKWHAKQRDQEESKIDENLDSPFVSYIPSTQLGVDVSLDELRSLGFSVILLAVGAWRDRPLAVPGIDEFQGRGFYYQNPFVAWFNRCHEPDFEGESIELKDDAIVVGGGLASIDVVKILMLSLTQEALTKRGLQVDLLTMEKKGIPRTLEVLGVSWEDLGLKGCTLYYRRRAEDMPLVPMEGPFDAAKEEKAKRVRQKVLDNARAKYLFNFEPCRLPIELLADKNRLTGLVFQKTSVTDEGVVTLPGTEYEVSSPLVVSSIGSLPEAIPGIPAQRYLYEIENEDTGKLIGLDGVFALGNAVTGRGNIRASRLHARQVAEWVIENHLVPDNAVGLLDLEDSRKILHRTLEFQERVGYDGDYKAWISNHLPIRLENLPTE
jgi:NADPH-dependent glutamate synthase beta subunit-like oxidoreductase